jgi:outer membrane protein assembly factor BamB
MIYILCMDSNARAIDPATGITQWETSITPGTYLSATPAYHNGKLYFGDQVDTYHCLSVADGSTVWSVPGVEHGSPGIAGDVVFYGEGSNYYDQTAHVFALNADNGQVIWSYNTTSGPYGIVSSPSITDGVMYIAGTDWNLYAFGTGLKYTYREDQFYAEVGSNQLIVTSYDDGSPVAADTVNFTVTQQGIVVDPGSGPHLCVSPNPCSGEATVDFSLPRAGSARLDIYDLTGRMVQTYATGSLSQGQHSIPLSTELPQGIYVVSLTCGDRCITGKLMVSR